MAWSAVACGIAVPLLRKKLRLHPITAIVGSAAAPLGLAVAVPRSRVRDAAIYALQMWAYIAAYEMPNDDPEEMMRRVHIQYPIVCDRAIGVGELPTQRLQPRANPGHLRRLDYALAWVHWLWYLFPHSVLIYTMVRDRERYPRAAVLIASVFDIGAIVYWLVPTAPPWYASERDLAPPMRRIMVEVGERTWGEAWEPAFEFLGGNPVAAMPSIHFASSLMAAHVLAETGPVAGAVGWGYTLALGYGLVYMGEHYVIDLAAGWALTESIRRFGPRFSPLLERVAGSVQAVEERARG